MHVRLQVLAARGVGATVQLRALVHEDRVMGSVLAQLVDVVLEQEVTARERRHLGSFFAVMLVGALLNLDGMVCTH